MAPALVAFLVLWMYLFISRITHRTARTQWHVDFDAVKSIPHPFREAMLVVTVLAAACLVTAFVMIWHYGGSPSICEEEYCVTYGNDFVRFITTDEFHVFDMFYRSAWTAGLQVGLAVFVAHSWSKTDITNDESDVPMETREGPFTTL